MSDELDFSDRQPRRRQAKPSGKNFLPIVLCVGAILFAFLCVKAVDFWEKNKAIQRDREERLRIEDGMKKDAEELRRLKKDVDRLEREERERRSR